MKKKVFLKTVSLMLLSSLMLIACSHSSSGSDHYYTVEVGFTGFDNYDFTANTVEEAVSYIGELTDEGTYVVKVIDTSETSCSSLKEALDSLREDILVCLDLSETSLRIGSSEFEGCENLSGIALPETLKEVGSYAFYDCINLKEVYIPDSVTRIGEYAFSGSYYYDDHGFYICNTNKLKTVILPKNLTVIERYTFCGCQNLEIVYLPNSLEYIDDEAFSGCKRLTTLTKDGNNKLPSSLKTIGGGAFFDCESLDTIDLSKTQLKEIPDDAFSLCTSLTTVYLPETIEYIGKGAFYMTLNIINDINVSKVIMNGSIKITIKKESGKAWGHTKDNNSASNPSASTLTIIPCFEENATYFLVGTGELQCGTSCCQGEDETCCGEGGENTCACAELTNDINTVETCGYYYHWYKVSYPE